MQPTLIIQPIPDIPVVKAGADLAQLIGDALAAANMTLQDGDIVVLAQKIVSLSEGRTVHLDNVEVSAAAEELAAAWSTSELHLIEDAGHSSATPLMAGVLIEAFDNLGRTVRPDRL